MAEGQKASGPSPEARRGLGSRLAALMREHLRPILIVVIPALLIAALSPMSSGLRELLFPTRVSVTGTLQLPRGEFPDLSVVLDGERRVIPDESGTFMFDGVRKGSHSVSVDGFGLSSRAVAFTVAAGSDDIDLNRIRVDPAIRLVGEFNAHPSTPSLTFDVILWVEGSPTDLGGIERVRYLTPSWLTPDQKPVRTRREAFCTHYVVRLTTFGTWVPTARAILASGGHIVVRLDSDESPSSPTPQCSTVVTNSSEDNGFTNEGGDEPPPQVPTVLVPSLVGMSREQALEVLVTVRLEAEVVEQVSDQPEGTVVAQDPPPRTEVEENSTVTITVAAGIEVPDVTGMPLEEAQAVLDDLGLEAVEGMFVDCGMDQGMVCEQDPEPGARVPMGTSITLTIQK